MLTVYKPGSIIAVSALLFLFMGLDKITIAPFAVNDRFGDVYADRTPVEISMLMAASSVGAAGTYNSKQEQRENY